jgi:hypothetical protein
MLTQVERDLEKTETAFADLHAKYQKAKQVVENYKMNEATLKDAVEKGQLAVNVAEGRYVRGGAVVLAAVVQPA